MEMADSSLYLHAVRFKRNAAAKRVYIAAQEAIRQPECNLSVFNIRFNGELIVIVLGDPPPADLDGRLQRILAPGSPAELPADLILMLTQRSIEERRKGPWSERHYGPGKRLI